MIEVFSGFGVVGILIGFGWLLGRANALGPHGAKVLADFVFLVAIPAMLFDKLLETDPRAVFSESLIIIAISSLGTGLVTLVLFRFLRHSAGESIMGMLAGSYTNAGNLGLPLAVYILGDGSAVVPVILFQIAFYAPISLTVLGMTQTRDQGPAWRNFVQALKNPMLLAAFLGILLAGRDMHLLVSEPIRILAGASVPLALVVFGMSLVGVQVALSRAMFVVVLAKNFLHPLAAGLLAYGVFGFEGPALYAAILLGSLPTAQNILAFAMRYGVGVQLARDAGVLTTIVSIPVLLTVTAIFM